MLLWSADVQHKQLPEYSTKEQIGPCEALLSTICICKIKLFVTASNKKCETEQKLSFEGRNLFIFDEYHQNVKIFNFEGHVKPRFLFSPKSASSDRIQRESEEIRKRDTSWPSRCHLEGWQNAKFKLTYRIEIILFSNCFCIKYLTIQQLSNNLWKFWASSL